MSDKWRHVIIAAVRLAILHCATPTLNLIVYLLIQKLIIPVLVNAHVNFLRLSAFHLEARTDE